MIAWASNTDPKTEADYATMPVPTPRRPMRFFRLTQDVKFSFTMPWPSEKGEDGWSKVWARHMPTNVVSHMADSSDWFQPSLSVLMSRLVDWDC